jgi:hypothetical protein
MAMEEFKRPDHPDFKDSKELAKLGWSGIRHNSITDYMELWVDGERKGELPTAIYNSFPERWAAIVEDVFAMKHVELINHQGKELQ